MSSGNRTFGASPDCSVIAKFGFLTDSPSCCSYRDISCRDGRVVAIESYPWMSSSLSSSSSSSNAKKDYRLPEDIGSLTELERLKVSMPKGTYYVSGSIIPSSIGKLSKLYELSLSDGGLTGPIPSEIATLPNLGILRLTKQYLSGVIPPGIGDLKNLTVLDLSDNQLTGSLPTGLGSRNLTTLSVSKNKLSGVVPKLSSTILTCDLTSYGSDNEFWCYGAGGAAPPAMCDTDTRLFLPHNCPAGLDGSGPLPYTRIGFIATIAVAVLIPLLAIFCVKKAKRVPTTLPETVEKPIGASAEGTDGDAAAATTGEATKKEEKPARKCLCFDLVPGVKILLGLQVLAGIALAVISSMLANSVASISPRRLANADMSISDRDFLAFMSRVSGGLAAWSSLLALFGLVCAVTKNLQGFKLFTAIYWGYIFAAPINLIITRLSASGELAVLPSSIASCVIQFYWGLCFAGYIEYLEEEKEKEMLADGEQEQGENMAVPATSTNAVEEA